MIVTKVVLVREKCIYEEMDTHTQKKKKDRFHVS